MATKKEILSEMFGKTKYEKYIERGEKLPKENIERVHEYFTKHTDDDKNVAFCAGLLLKVF